MAKILVTGASGFIGRHLVAHLCAQGHAVRCLVRRTSRIDHLAALDVELVRGTLAEHAVLRAAVAGTDYVYHLAALTSALRFADLLRVNGLGTVNVARACAAQTTPPVLVYCSSIAAAGPVARGQIRTEQDPAQPMSNYGHSKRAGEIGVAGLAHAVPTTVVRPGIVFGPWNRELLPAFRWLYRLRVHAIPGVRSPRLSFIHVTDLVAVLTGAARKGTRLPVDRRAAPAGTGYYFACAPEFPDYFQFGRMLRDALGRPHALLLHFPEPFPWLMAAVNQLARRWVHGMDSFNLDKIREALAGSWACSPTAARRDLGFQPSASLRDQLCAAAAWYREHGWL